MRAKPSQIQRRSRGVMDAASSTIIDVARKAGVSVSTVSHVINRTRRVMPETARLVEAAIAQRRLPAQHAGALAEDGVHQQRRHRDLGDLQSLFQRHHLRDRDRMRAARADGVSLRHAGRSRARTRRSCRRCTSAASTASSWRRRPTRERRALELSRETSACPACWSIVCPIRSFDQVGVENGRRCERWSAMSPRSATGASATSPAIRASRPRWSASRLQAALAAHGLAFDPALARHRQRDDRRARRPRRMRLLAWPSRRPRSSPATT